MSAIKQGDEVLRRYIDFLREKGINNYVSLPEIAVMGDTSSGKSSLLSAITQIQLPSNDKITTRCPLRLRMEESDHVKAVIRIRWDTTLTEVSGTPWAEVKMDTWEGVDEHIASAQQAILDERAVAVASDVVEVDVYGPSCLNLTVIDLPGIVRSVGKSESATLIEDIKKLTRNYLDNPRCVILAVHPANVDFHNSQIMHDAKEVDPATARTIPVITKPDQIDSGAEGNVHDLLLGKLMEFDMGFHMVKCRGQKDLNDGKTLQQGLEDEQTFFAKTAPWKNEPNSKLFGIPELRRKLARLQVQCTRASIPGIIKEIAAKRTANDEILKTLGTLLSTDQERRNFVATSTKRMMQQVKGHLAGSASVREGQRFLAAQVKEFATFRDNVLKQRLNNVAALEVGSSVIVYLDDGSEEKGKIVSLYKSGDQSMVTVKPEKAEDSKLCSSLAAIGSPDVVGKKEGDVVLQYDGKHYILGANQAYGYQIMGFSVDIVELDPTWLKELIAENPTTDLPCFLNARVFNTTVAEMVEDQWRPLCESLIHSRHTALSQIVTNLANEAFPESYEYLRHVVLDKVNQVLQEWESASLLSAATSLQREKTPFTLNHYLFDNIAKLRNRRLKNRLMRMVKGKTEGIEGIVQAVFDSVEKMSLEDCIAHEMQIVLDAYGKVAAKRVMDEVPMIFRDQCLQLMPQLDATLQFTDKELVALMQEDAAHIVKVNRAQQTKEKLDIAHDALQKLLSGTLI